MGAPAADPADPAAPPVVCADATPVASTMAAPAMNNAFILDSNTNASG